MGKRGMKSLNLEEDEEVDNASRIVFLKSDNDEDDDAEANEDLSLKIVDKALLRKFRDASSGGGSMENGGDFEAEIVTHGKSSKDKKKDKKIKKKKKQKSEAEVDSALTEKDAPFENFCSDLFQVDVAKEEEKTESNKTAEIVLEAFETNPVETSDNIVLRKLLRGPRYFDPPDSSWGTCYNCGEEGHTTANCTSARRKKPCFVCGSLEHNAKRCTKAQDCFICQKGGHRAKDCPEKSKGGPQNSKMCIKCGESGHEMFSCQNNYCPDDLKEIQCYICKCLGHLCCVDYIDGGPGVVSCYRCGFSGHTGLACARSRGETSGSSSVSSCFRCGEEGHFARECTNPMTALKRSRQLSTPKQRSSKENRDKLEIRSAPNEIGRRSRKKRKTKYEGQIASASKPKQRHDWVTEDHGDSLNCRFKTGGKRSPAAASYKRTHHAAALHASASHSARKPCRLSYSNSSPNGSAKFRQHRYSGLRYGNSSNGGIGRNLDFH